VTGSQRQLRDATHEGAADAQDMKVQGAIPPAKVG
jgi:hypothetical protein